MKRKDPETGTVWITGATGGLGEASVFVWASNGWDVVAIARNVDKLKNLQDRFLKMFPRRKFHPVVCDLTGERRFDWVHQMGQQTLSPHVFIMNAGCGVYGSFHTQMWEKQYTVLRVNLSSVILFTRQILEVFPCKDIRRMVFIGSTSGRKPVPYMTTYGATKAGLHSFALSLDTELKPMGVRTLLVLPGSINTDFHEKANFPDALKNKGLHPMTVAHHIFTAVEHGNHGILQLGSWQEKIGGVLQRILHPWFWARIMGKRYDPSHSNH